MSRDPVAEYRPERARTGGRREDADHIAEHLVSRTEAELGRIADELRDVAPLPTDPRVALQHAGHDLQAPLSAFALRLAILQRHAEQGDLAAIQSDIEVLRRAQGKMMQVVSALMTTPTEGIREEEVILDALVRDVLDTFRDDPAHLACEVTVRPLPVLLGDRTALTRLFQNLIENALKYREGARRLHILISATATADGGSEICVADNGRGFDPALAEAILHPGTRAAADVAGHGIGLASCVDVAEAHQATLRAHGNPGTGAAFTVTFPPRRVLLMRHA